jgi:OOP family OmpA-OmpF porin
MKNLLAAITFLCFLSTNVFAQGQPVRAKALAISFIMNDYTSAQRLHTTTPILLFRDKQWAKFSEMSPGLALTYFKGLRSHLDFAGTLAASYVNYSLPNKAAFSNDGFLLEADASIQLKLLSEQYLLTPYLSAGAGASKYRSYYGAFIPVGAGLKVNIFDEASIFLSSQYRVPVTTQTATYHLMYSFGIAGVIGK